MTPTRSLLAPLLFTAAAATASAATPAALDNWPSWRGPHQDGTSAESDLPDAAAADETVWTYPISGRGTPAVFDGRVYVFGYDGEGADLQEVLACLNEADGTLRWERRFNDFLSDVVYDRYSLGAPAVDPETGDVFLMTSGGLFLCFSSNGELRWQHSAMEELGRLTFPNGRNGAVLIAEDKAIAHFVTSSFGPQGPAQDRFFAFDKRTGAILWVSQPGAAPKDNSFSYPVLARRGPRLVLYAGTGCGHVVCVDARSGEPLWRYPAAIGGINSSVVLHGEQLIAIHGVENLDTSTIGRMLSLPLDLPAAAAGAAGTAPAAPAEGTPVMPASAELWRNDLCAFSSSPVLAEGRVYQTTATGDLCCVDAASGAVLWHEKLAPDQVHASPVFGDGKLYVPMTNGTFVVAQPTDKGPGILSRTQLEGECLGAPAIANGRVYVHTTKRLYVFGAKTPASASTAALKPAPAVQAAGAPARLRVAPAEILLRPGEKIPLDVRELDAAGIVCGVPAEVTWDAGKLSVRVTNGVLEVPSDGAPCAGVLKASAGGRSAAVRVRVVPKAPYTYDFESAVLAPNPKEEGLATGPAPDHWLSAGPKWEVRAVEGGKALAKTLENPLFQRSTSFVGHPDDANYTFQIDILTDGNARSMSNAGVVNQRYLIELKGNHQAIEISSNVERIKESAPFRWSPGVWYTLKTRVDVAADGSGVVRAKAWKRGDPEPEAWTLEVPHKTAHRSGAPALFGFTPQSRFRVYVDNLSVTPNE